MKKKLLSVLLIVSLVVLSIAGCSKPAVNSSSGASESGSGSGNVTTIKFINGFTGGDGEFMTKIVNGFNESQDEYYVDMLITDDHYTKFKSDDFDMVIMHADWLSTYVQDGLIRKVDDLYEKAGLTIDDFADVAKTYVVQDGSLWAFPLDIFGYTMFYNKKYVDEPPKTYDDLLALKEKLDSENTNIWPLGLPLKGEHQWTMISLLAQFGYDYEGEEHLEFASREAAEILMKIHDMIYKDGISPANLGVDDHCNLFIATADSSKMQTVLSLTGPWDYTAFHEVWGDDLGVATVPVIGDKLAVNGSGHNFAVSSKVTDQKVLDGIAAFMKYVYNPEVLLNWADSGQAPIHKATMEVVKQNADKYQTAVNTYSMVNNIKVLPKLYNVRNQIVNLNEKVWTELVTNPDLTVDTLMPLLEDATKYAEEMAQK